VYVYVNIHTYIHIYTHTCLYIFIYIYIYIYVFTGYRGPKKDGLDFFVEHIVWKQLPKELFETFGGRDAAKLRRQEILISQGKGMYECAFI
jgi:hypothetical protein